MSKEITLAEVREGDRVRVTREFSVDLVDGSRLLSTSLPTGSLYAGNAKIELLDRPIDLPTQKGSVIRVRTGQFGGPGTNRGTWILTETPGGHYPEWVSASRAHLTPAEFKDFLVETPRRTFEVIA